MLLHIHIRSSAQSPLASRSLVSRLSIYCGFDADSTGDVMAQQMITLYPLFAVSALPNTTGMTFSKTIPPSTCRRTRNPSTVQATTPRIYSTLANRKYSLQ